MAHHRYKLWKVLASGRRQYIGMFWSQEKLNAVIKATKLRSGQRTEVQPVDVGDIPEQCKPGSTKATMNGRPVKGRAENKRG